MADELPSGLPSLSQSVAPSAGLGSLAQSARAKQLKTARGILIVVGALTIAMNGFLFVNARHEVDEVFQKQGFNVVGGQNRILADARDRAVRYCQMIYGSTVALGVVFVVLGIVVRTYPVPATVLGLVLYVGAIAVFGYLAPETLAQALIFRIFVVVALAKSIQAAVAYQKG